MGAERALSGSVRAGARSGLQQISPRSRERRDRSPAAAAGTKARSGSATRAACCGATSRTTASCAGTRRPAASAIYRKPSNNANGNTRDRQGRLVTCEHDARRVTRTEYDGTITVLIDKFDGKPLNSPNDIVVKSDDSIWFTDPPFGILGNYEGHAATPELPTNVYRLDPRTRQATAVTRRRLPAERACLLARRVEALRRRMRPRRRARSSSTTSPTTAPSSPTSACSSPPSRAARRTASASTPTAICGAAGAWATRSRTA